LAATTVRHFLWHALGTAVLTAFGAWLVTRQTGLPLQQPPAGALFALLGAGGAIGLSAAPRRALLLLAAALLLATMPSLRADESALDEVFGPAAGSQLAEAEAQLLRGPYTIHDARSADYRVFLLGGQLLYGRAHESAAPEEHLEVLLAGDLQVALDLAAPRRVDVPCLATENAHAAQQWDVFRRFYTGYRPGVIVFGVSSFELDAAPASTAASHVESLGRTLTAVADYCAEHGIGLVLLADPGLPGVFRAALDRIAARGCPLVEIAAGEAPTSISKRLTAAIAPLLRP
ncbi:MAG: hypothetical protein KDE27_11555, partial [Planctomycetes bacterium]|nr:hypothetical protein [Planctomycetota bacterium]